MNSCCDPEKGKKLDAYLFDLLLNDDRESFEKHLLECDRCANEVEEYNKIAVHLVYSSTIQDETKLIIDGQETSLRTPKPSVLKPQKRVSNRKSITLVFVAAAVVVLLALWPWKFELSPTHEAVAYENQLAVLPFSTLPQMSEQSWLGEAAASLIIADLSESKSIRVVSSLHFEDILNFLGMSVDSLANIENAVEVANKARARWFLSGTIRQTEPNLVLEILVADAADGDTLIFEKLVGGETDNLFSMIDVFTGRLREKMLVFDADSSDIDCPVAEITTHSAKAYRYYIEGLNNYRKFYWDDAMEGFHKAIYYDSTFAMAYYFMSRLESTRYIDSAVIYVSACSQKEKYLIKGYAALLKGDTADYILELTNLVNAYPHDPEGFLRLGTIEHQRSNYPKAFEYLEKTISIDPYNREAYNTMAYAYARIKKRDKALDAINQYVRIAPGEANPYDSRGEIYAMFDQVDSAIASYKKAIEIKPDMNNTAFRLAILTLHKRQYNETIKWLKYQAEQENQEGIYPGFLSSVYGAQGHLEKASNLLDDYINKVKSDTTSDEYHKGLVDLRIKVVLLYSETNLSRAILGLEQALTEIDPKNYKNYSTLAMYLAQLHAENGAFTKASNIVDQLKNHTETDPKLLYSYQYSNACVLLAQGNPEQAVLIFEKLTSKIEPKDSFTGYYMLSRAYIENGQNEKAIELLNRIISEFNYKRMDTPTWNAKLHYWLGIAYENANQIEKARAQYTQFLEIWREADTDIIALDDTRQRLQHLSGI